jgi:polysaccharide biosynthesis transport protein
MTRAAATDAGQADVALLRYWPVLVKRRWLVLTIFTLVVLAGLIGASLITPTYRATAMLQLQRQASRTVTVPGVTPVEESGDSQFYETQLQLLQSRNMAERVAAALDPDDTQLAALFSRSPWEKVEDLFLGTGQSSQPPGQAEIRHKLIVEAIMANLIVDPVIDSIAADRLRWHNLLGIRKEGLVVSPWVPALLVRIHFDSPDAALSAKIANAVAAGLVQSTTQHRQEANAFAKGFLADRLEQLRLTLQDSEQALAGAAHNAGVVDIRDPASLSSGDLSALVTSLSLAKADRIDAEVRLRQSRNISIHAQALMLQDQRIEAMRHARADLDSEYQEKLLIYMPEYPLMVQLTHRIKSLDQQLAVEIAAFRAQLAEKLSDARNKESMLQGELDLLSNHLLEWQSRRGSFTLLERDVVANRKLYALLLQRYKEIDATSNRDSRHVSVVDAALTPVQPFAPDVPVYLGWTAVLGLVLGVLGAALVEFLDATLKRPEDVEKNLGISVLGVIPKLDQLGSDQARRNSRSAFSESYRSTRTSLEFSSEQGTPRCLLVTSTSASEGKSTTALALARSYTQLGRRVLLIDADLRNPSLHHVLGCKNSVGLTDYLSGRLKAAAVIRPTKTLRLIFIPSGPMPPNPAELLAGSRMAAMLELVGQKFDQVIIDGPPIMGLADAPILSSIASGTLVVIQAEAVRIASARLALKRLIHVRAHVVGALLTKFGARSSIYGEEQGGYHYHSYGEALRSLRKPLRESRTPA